MNSVGGRLDLRKLLYFKFQERQRERDRERQTERAGGPDPQ